MEIEGRRSNGEQQLQHVAARCAMAVSPEAVTPAAADDGGRASTVEGTGHDRGDTGRAGEFCRGRIPTGAGAPRRAPVAAEQHDVVASRLSSTRTGCGTTAVDERQVTRLARDVAAIRGWALRADAGMNRELVKRVSRGRSWNRRPLHVAGTPAAAHVSGRA